MNYVIFFIYAQCYQKPTFLLKDTVWRNKMGRKRKYQSEAERKEADRLRKQAERYFRFYKRCQIFRFMNALCD